MKIAALLFLAVSPVTFQHHQVKYTSRLPALSPDSVLQKVYNKLSGLQNIRYVQTRELSYASEHYHNVSDWSVFCDFRSTDTLSGFRYQIDNEISFQVFNGTEKFDLNKKQKTLTVNTQPSHQSFDGISAFYNSIITLRNALPLIIADKTIQKAVSDTTVDQAACYLVTLDLGKRRIDYLGRQLEKMQTKNNFIYKIIINKKDNFPLSVRQVNDLNDDFIKTDFTKVSTNVSSPAELTWYYSTYMDTYQLAGQKELPRTIPAGTEAPGWTLPLYNSDKTIALHDLKGKVVLLDFWIKNCGPCIKSVPALNTLQEKFGNSQFEIIGINAYDAPEDIAWFCKKHQPRYQILMQGKAVVEKYGVSAFPTMVLLDRKGKVLFAGAGPEEAEIEKLVKEAL